MKFGKMQTADSKAKESRGKSKIMFKAIGLKTNQYWRGVSITHDLAKQQGDGS